jgi:hypothetical protein
MRMTNLVWPLELLSQNLALERSLAMDSEIPTSRTRVGHPRVSP